MSDRIFIYKEEWAANTHTQRNQLIYLLYFFFLLINNLFFISKLNTFFIYIYRYFFFLFQIKNVFELEMFSNWNIIKDYVCFCAVNVEKLFYYISFYFEFKWTLLTFYYYYYLTPSSLIEWDGGLVLLFESYIIFILLKLFF